MTSMLFGRQVVVDENGNVIRNYWWTEKGQLIRWGIFTGIFVLLLLYIIIGYAHAKRRINKGLPPLAYHRWLLSRQQRAIHDPSYRDPMPWYTTYRPQQYGMDTYGPNSYPQAGVYAPPGYEYAAPPPTYQPGGNKIDPSQWRAAPTRRPVEAGDELGGGEPAPVYSPPMGAPPPAARLNQTATGSSSVSNNPYRP